MKRYRSPSYYRAPLRSRAEIVAFLKDAANDRPQYGLFAFNVKDRSTGADYAFPRLLAIAQADGIVSKTASKRYLDACAELWAVQRERPEFSEVVLDRCRESVTGDDTYRMLWDGESTVAEWEFAGRSGGWLVLSSFDGIRYAGRDAFTIDDVAALDWIHLYRLYRFIVQCLHDFRPEAVKDTILHETAFHFFENVCADIETDAHAAAREAADKAEAAERAEWEARDTVTRRG